MHILFRHVNAIYSPKALDRLFQPDFLALPTSDLEKHFVFRVQIAYIHSLTLAVNGIY